MNTYKENKVIKNFYDYLVTKNYSKETVDEYCYNVYNFFCFIKEYKELDIEVNDFELFVISNIKESDIYEYMIYLNSYLKNKVNTRNFKLASLKSFFMYFYKNFNIDRANPAKEIMKASKVDRLPKFLSKEQAIQLCKSYTPKNSKQYIRNNTIIFFLLQTGLRRQELINLNINDVDFENKRIKVICKGNKQRIIYINDDTKNVLMEYLRYRKVGLDSEEPLFTSYSKNRLGRTTLKLIIKNAYEIIGLGDKGYTIHTLRHTAATLIYKATKGDLLIVRDFLGHSSITSTQIYAHIDEESVRRIVDNNPLNIIKEKR